jgi:myosin V
MLQVKQQDLLKALTTRSIDLMGEKIVKHLDLKGALVSRDSMAKNIYSKLFDWLVSAINRKISALGLALPHTLHLCLSL